MSVRKQDVWALQLVYLFMNKYEYRLVSTNSASQTDEIWLTNAKHQYPVIRICPYAAVNDTFDIPRIRQVYEAILNMMHAKGTLLNIHLSDEMPSQNETDIFEYCLSNDYRSSVLLDEIFPELGNLLHPLEDAAKTYEELSRGIQLLQLKTLGKKPKQGGWKEIPLSFYLIGICLLVFLLGRYFTRLYDDPTFSAILCGALYKTLVYGNYEVWRVLTCGFVHIQVMHLFCNMYALFNIGPSIERIFGRGKFLISLLGSIVLSSLFVLLGSENNVTVGISGGLFGLLAMMLVYSIETNTIRDKRVLSSFMQLLLINVMISLLPGVSLLGHLGGFVAGLFFGLLFSTRKEWSQLRFNSLAAFCALVAALCLLTLKDHNKGPIYDGTDRKYLVALEDFHLDWYQRWTEDNLHTYYATVEK